MQVFGNFKAKDMKDYLFWHDRSIKELIECFDSNWTEDQRLSFAEKCCANRMLDVDVHSALRMVIAAFLEGESKILADKAEVNNPENMELHKSGLELWRLLACNSDRASALNVVSILESIRNMQAAKNVQDVRLKLNALDRRHQEYYRQAVTSMEPEFVNMKTHGISVYSEVFKKADLLKVLLDSIVKELKKSANTDFEKDSYSEVRDVVTPTVHNHMNAATPRDVCTHIMSIEKEKSKGESEEYGDNSDEDHGSEQHSYHDEEGGPICFM